MKMSNSATVSCTMMFPWLWCVKEFQISVPIQQKLWVITYWAFRQLNDPRKRLTNTIFYAPQASFKFWSEKSRTSLSDCSEQLYWLHVKSSFIFENLRQCMLIYGESVLALLFVCFSDIMRGTRMRKTKWRDSKYMKIDWLQALGLRMSIDLVKNSRQGRRWKDS